MKGVIERGTGARAKVLQRPLAGKTGTTDDATDLWFVGFSPSLVAGVWIGYDDKRSLGSAETGGRLALPIWIHFMQKALAGTEAEDFPAPNGAGPTHEDLQLGRSAPPGNRASVSEPPGQGAALAGPAAIAPPLTPATDPAPRPAPAADQASPRTAAPSPAPGPGRLPSPRGAVPPLATPPPQAGNR
jgi:penicillin-binding protein 1A